MAVIELDQDQWQRLKPLLTAAVRLSPEDRASFLGTHLSDDSTLQSCALEMLRLYDKASRSFNTTSGDTVTGSVTSRTSVAFDRGQAIGHYRVVRKLGEGGMGTVYLAEDERLGRFVALKLVDRSTTEELGGTHARVVAESRSIAVLNHPGIVVLYDVFEHDDELLLVMEYVEGRPLSELIASGPIPTGFALQLIAQVADAVAYAHARGVLHCDLKPSNIQVLASGATKVLDFGLARMIAAQDADETRPLRVIGTVGYLSPEQLCFRPPTSASDVYALGVVLYELLTGQPPFTPDAEAQVLFSTISAAPPLASSVIPGVPPAVDELVARCLAKNPRDRLQAHELATAARNAIPLVDGAPTEVERQTRAPARRHTALRRIIASVVGAILLGLVLWVTPTSREQGAWRWPWAATPRAPADAPPISLAILRTSGALQDSKDTAMGKAIPALLRPALSRIGGVNVVLLDDDAAAADVAPAIAMKALGATLAIRCILGSADGKDAVDVELFAANSAAPISRASVPFDGDDPSRTFERVLLAVERGLAARVPRPQPAQSAKSAAGLVPSTLALTHFTEALDMLDRPDVPGNVTRAITLLQSAIQSDPSSALAHAALARAQWMNYVETKSEDSARQAKASIITALGLDNQLVPVKLTAAIIQRGVGELDRAESTLQEVIAAAPASDEAHRLLGELLTAGQPERAQKEFDAAIALRPLYWRNHRAKGLAYYGAGNYESAAVAFAKVTELQPDSAWGFQMLGTALHQLGNYQDAEAAYATALKLGPSAAAWSNIGKLQYDSGQYEKAVQSYKEALKIRSASALTWRNLGDVLTVVGKKNEARDAYQHAEDYATRATRVNPSDGGSLSTLAVIHAKLGRYAEAMAEAEKAIALAPRDRVVFYRQAVVYMLAGQRSRAQTAIEAAIGLGFSDKEARLDRDLRGLDFTAR